MLSHYGHRYLVSGPLLVTIEWRAYLLATSLITIPLLLSPSVDYLPPIDRFILVMCSIPMTSLLSYGICESSHINYPLIC